MAKNEHDSPMASVIGRSRIIVVVAVVAVLLSAFSLFLLGAWAAVGVVINAWSHVAEIETSELIIEFLEIVTVMLKAVFFYLTGVGLYSLFIAPLNVTVALGIETLNDLETKIISVIIVIMAVAFLERFIQRDPPLVLLQEAGAFGIVVVALVLFKAFTNREGIESRKRREQEAARREMFEHSHEQRDIPPE